MLASGFQPIRDAAKTVVTSLMPTADIGARRYYRFLDALQDWEVACQAYDVDFEELHDLRQTLFPEDVSSIVLERFERFNRLALKVQYDIRCFYIFAKIAFITYGALLFTLAGEPSGDWRRARDFSKRVKRATARPLLRQFHTEFGSELEWFLGHVNHYRNEFIEHPNTTSILGGLVVSQRGARISGLTGRGFSQLDQELLVAIRSKVLESHAELSNLDDLATMEWLHANFDVVPEHYREKALNMFTHVGLDSGDLAEVSRRIIDMFTRFISFIQEPLSVAPGGARDASAKS